MGVGGQHHVQADYIQGRNSVPTIQEARWTLGPVWTGTEISPPTEIRSPDRLAHRVAIPNKAIKRHQISNYCILHLVVMNEDTQLFSPALIPAVPLTGPATYRLRSAVLAALHIKPAPVVVHVSGIKAANSSVTLNSQANCTNENRPFEAYIHRDGKPLKISGLCF
jgi:hypothetical protein